MCTCMYLQHPLCIVCDTGILLSHLDIIAKYKDEPIPEAGQAVFLLPWTVLQELDQLHTHSESSVLQRVLKAVEVLRQFMESKHLRILFQSYSEVGKIKMNNVLLFISSGKYFGG